MSEHKRKRLTAKSTVNRNTSTTNLTDSLKAICLTGCQRRDSSYSFYHHSHLC